MELLQCLNASLLMAFRVLALAFGGVMLAKRKIIDIDTNRNIGMILSDFVMPCLIFNKILANFNVAEYQIWVPVAILTFCNVALSFECFLYLVCVFSGLLAGYLLAKFFFKYKKSSQLRLLSVIFGFSYAGSIQLTMISAMTSTLNQIAPRNPNVKFAQSPSQRAIMYVMLSWVLIVSIRWSIGYALLAPDQNDTKLYDLSESDQILVLDESDSLKQFKRHNLTCKEKCAKTFNIPIIVSIISLIIASIAPVKNLFLQGGIFNSTVMQTCAFIGEGYYILMIILMGATLTLFKGQKLELSISTHILTIFFKLVVFPWIGVAVVIPLYYWDFLSDPMLVFVILVLFAAPPANILIIMANMQKNFEEDLAKSLLIAYSLSIFTLTAFSALFLYLL